MRKIKNILLALLLIAGLQGCNSFLTVDIPDQLLKENYWQTRDQVNAALNGVYYQLGQNITRFIAWGDVRSDLYTLSDGSNDYGYFIDQDVKTKNSLVKWGDVYVGINWANSFIKNAEGALEYDQSLTREEVVSMKAEAYAIRALYYFYLVRTFQDVPVFLEPYESDTQYPYGPAVPEAQVLKIIESDLEKALQDAPVSFSSPEKHHGRITCNAVKAIWADVKLWKGEYKECIALCEELGKDYDSKLLGASAWFSIFATGNTGESIFEYQYLDEKRPSTIVNFFLNNRLSSNFLAFGNNIKKVYPSLGGSRLADTVRYPRTVVGSSLFKYTGMSADGSSYVFRDETSRQKMNFIFYRYREVLLMKSEACAMLGDYDQAIEAINQIRRSISLDEVGAAEYGKDQAFMDKLLCERAAELGYEGKQWYSMVRIALHTKYDELLIDRIASTNFSVKEQTMKARLIDQRGWFLPYHYDEIQNNLDLRQKEFYIGKD